MRLFRISTPRTVAPFTLKNSITDSGVGVISSISPEEEGTYGTDSGIKDSFSLSAEKQRGSVTLVNGIESMVTSKNDTDDDKIRMIYIIGGTLIIALIVIETIIFGAYLYRKKQRRRGEIDVEERMRKKSDESDDSFESV
ncbi:unnamed protein product [Didymodactylos carnosus]|uniref:Uncharacterized protein n=2 Tax=Didymodactylos carnosus TaxID=1234261 RepID=A0A814T895_9BILA|nr:unnamed protein product [Didymodactylos carnosus]CAF3920699.1 unnamed protein product [Didymodactylos carnosus]